MNLRCELAPARPAATPVRRQVAALAEVVDYVSDRLGELGAALHEPWFSAQSGRLHLTGGSVEAEVGPFLIRSDSTPLFKAASPEIAMAWSSTIRVRTRSGLPVSAEALMRLQTTDNAVIALDRLCRVLHMLNHLLQARETLDLWVPLGLRHLLAVDAGHGAFFDEILQRCGLGAERIVLLVTPGQLRDAEWSHLQRACAAYRQRGFRVATEILEAPGEIDLAKLAAVEPDWICGPVEIVQSLDRQLPGAGRCIEASSWPESLATSTMNAKDLLRLPADRTLSFLL